MEDSRLHTPVMFFRGKGPLEVNGQGTGWVSEPM